MNPPSPAEAEAIRQSILRSALRLLHEQGFYPLVIVDAKLAAAQQGVDFDGACHVCEQMLTMPAHASYLNLIGLNNCGAPIDPDKEADDGN